MGYLLRMSGEIHDWLAALRDADPPAAILVGAALTALIRDGSSLGPPLVSELADPAAQPGSPESLDQSYQDRLGYLQIVRRGAADAATLATDIRQQIAELESQAELGDRSGPGSDAGSPDPAAAAEHEPGSPQNQLAELRRLLPGVLAAQRKLSEHSQQLQERTDAFRAQKEVFKARYAAAQAMREAAEVLAAFDDSPGDQGRPGADPDAPRPQAADSPLQAAPETSRQPERPARGPARFAMPPGLMELRPDAPGDGETRILFAVEPPGTALLISVLEGRDAVRHHYEEAAALSAEVLRSVRAGHATEAAEHAFDDAESFLDEFFPGGTDEVTAAAAALIACHRGRTLAEQRALLGLTQAQVAERMGVSLDHVCAIEHADPAATELSSIASYVRALGGQLEVTANFGGERVQLR